MRDGILGRLRAIGIEVGPLRVEIPADILGLVREREKARGAGDWKRADEIRADLRRRGWTLEDSPRGTLARPA